MTRPCCLLVLLAVALLPLGALGGCASVLGVDKTYALADASTSGDGGASDGGGSDGADGGTSDAATTDGGTTSGEIRCAPGSPCTAGTQECCLAGDGGLSCTSPTASDPCPNGTDIVCDDPSDCPGAACCLQLDTSLDLLATRCASSCSNGDLTACDPQGAACAQGTCTAVAVQPQPPLTSSWFYACQ
jgi:hypothetical protein